MSDRPRRTISKPKVILPSTSSIKLRKSKSNTEDTDDSQNKKIKTSPKESKAQPPKVEVKELELPKYVCPLPCRETQFGDILAFLESNLELKNSGCMYVSGVPGTGKTVIVKAVIDSLREYSTKKGNVKFKDVYINGLTLSAPNRIWKRFYKELNPDKNSRITPESACNKLGLYFEKRHDPIILVIDELDQILDKDKHQSIMYRFLDWTAHPTNLLSLICIFNTMHLPETVLTMRNASRMGMSRCGFPPYTHDQLATIVRRALGDEKSNILNEAITLVSRKVAAISGDARRALEIAKRTLEIVESNTKGNTGNVSVIAVTEAFKELFSSPKTEAVKQCTSLEKLILRSIINEIQTSGSEETHALKVINSVGSLATFSGSNSTTIAISADHIIKALRMLYASKLILMESNTSSLYNKISLNVSIPDIEYGLKNPVD